MYFVGLTSKLLEAFVIIAQKMGCVPIYSCTYLFMQDTDNRSVDSICESHWKKMTGKPYSGKLNVRFDEGELEIAPYGYYASSLLYPLHFLVFNYSKGLDENIDVKKMKGKWKGYYRIKIGKVRMILRIDFKNKIAFIDKIDFRGNIYK